MSSTNAEPSSLKGSAKRVFAALLTNLDWKKNKKRIMLMAGGAVLAVVIVVLIPRGGANANGNSESQIKSLVPAVQSKVAETPPPRPPEQPASTFPGLLPPWMPVYPATIPEIASSSVTPEGDKQTIATFKSDDKPTKIVQFYQTKLQEGGFKIESASSGEPGGMIQANDAEKKRTLILNVDAQETGTLSRVVTVQRK